MPEFQHGRLECIVGCVCAGKTEELLKRLRRAKIAKHSVQLFKPAGEQWWGPEPVVVSHHKSEMAATPIPTDNPRMILELLKPETKVVGIEEGQFFDSLIVEVCEELVHRQIRVIIAALDTDFMGRPFGSVPILLALADVIAKETAICTVCGKAATRSQRLDASEELVVIGSTGKYAARCKLHFSPPPQ